MTPTPTPSFLSTLLSFKTKVILVTGLLVMALLGGTLAVHDYRDTKAKLAQALAVQSTQADVMKKLGDALTAAAQVKPQATVTDAATAALGKQVTAYMAATSAQIRSLTTAVGTIATQVQTGKPVTVVADASGGFKNTTVVEARPQNAPPLAEVALSWDPKAKDLSSVWTTYREDFSASIGEWQKKDTGYTSAVALHRDIYKADPTAPGGYLKIGTEPITMQNAEVTYNEKNFDTAQAPLPRWDAILGAGHDNSGSGRTVAVGILGYRLSDNLSLHLGQVGSTSILGGGYQFSLGK
jgi:hypothetical protein